MLLIMYKKKVATIKMVMPTLATCFPYLAPGQLDMNWSNVSNVSCSVQGNNAKSFWSGIKLAQENLAKPFDVLLEHENIQSHLFAAPAIWSVVEIEWGKLAICLNASIITAACLLRQSIAALLYASIILWSLIMAI